jgi:hypothetical protein
MRVSKKKRRCHTVLQFLFTTFRNLSTRAEKKRQKNRVMTTNLRYVRMKQPGIRSRDTRCKKKRSTPMEIIVGPFFCYIEKYRSGRKPGIIARFRLYQSFVGASREIGIGRVELVNGGDMLRGTHTRLEKSYTGGSMSVLALEATAVNVCLYCVAPVGPGGTEIAGVVKEVTELGAFAPNFSSVSVPDSSGESSGCVGR